MEFSTSHPSADFSKLTSECCSSWVGSSSNIAGDPKHPFTQEDMLNVRYVLGTTSVSLTDNERQSLKAKDFKHSGSQKCDVQSSSSAIQGLVRNVNSCFPVTHSTSAAQRATMYLIV